MSGNGDHETRERLLREAERLFAARGFGEVTVREICSAAKANVAAINYHFGDKLGLYREVLSGAIAGMQRLTEDAREAGLGLEPAEQLRTYITLFLNRALTAGSETIRNIIQREVTDPTPALNDFVDRALRPRLEYLAGIVGAMIDRDPADPQVKLCVMSIQAQVLMCTRHNAVADRLGYIANPSASEIEQLADHIANFSIGGVTALRS